MKCERCNNADVREVNVRVSEGAPFGTPISEGEQSSYKRETVCPICIAQDYYDLKQKHERLEQCVKVLQADSTKYAILKGKATEASLKASIFLTTVLDKGNLPTTLLEQAISALKE